MTFVRRALAVLCLSIAAASAPAAALQEPQAAQPEKPRTQGQGGTQERRTLWWRDTAVHKELDLSARQIAKLEKIATAAWPSLREAHKQLEGLQDETNRLIRENTADEKVLAALLDKLETVRSRINKERTLMAFRMHQALTPEQYRKLTQINERRRKESGRR